MRHRSQWISLVLALVLPAAIPGAARAQDSAPPAGGTDTGGDGDDGPIAEPDIPDAPPAGDAITADDLEGGARKTVTHRWTKRDYPLEIVQRPLTLAAAQAEVSLEMPFMNGDGQPILWHVLRARYGITRDIEAGITYGFDLLNLSPPEGGKTFEAGKGFSFDGGYTIWPQHLAVTLSLPFYVDPDAFGMGVNLGIPFRVNLGSRWAIFGGQDLLQMKIVKMPVDPSNPAYNLGVVAAAEGGTKEPLGNLAINLGGMYQIRPNLNAFATMGFRYPDFDDNGAPVAFFGGATWSKNRRLDIGGRIGSFDLAHSSEFFSLSVYAAYRL